MLLAWLAVLHGAYTRLFSLSNSIMRFKAEDCAAVEGRPSQQNIPLLLSMIKAKLISYLEALDLANVRGNANVRCHNPVGGAFETVVDPVCLDAHDPLKGEHEVV